MKRLGSFFRAGTLTPAGMLAWAALIASTFGITHLADWREQVSLLSGTMPPGSSLAAAQAKAAIYLASYFGTVIAVPILVLAALLLGCWQRIGRLPAGSSSGVDIVRAEAGVSSGSMTRSVLRWCWSLCLHHRALLCGTAFAIALFNARWLWTGQFKFSFLIWNLFLAWIPLGLAELLAERLRRSGRFDAAGGGLACAWLLFFPNAPYLLTDLLHWKPRPEAPPWVDLLLLVHFALLGLSLGFASLRVMRRLVETRLGQLSAHIFTVGVLLLASFGIYLGRFRRWNSWDVLLAPHSLAAELADLCLRPWQHPRAWGFTLALGGSLILVWWAIDRAAARRDPEVA